MPLIKKPTNWAGLMEMKLGVTKVAMNQALAMSRKKSERIWASLGLMGIN